MPELAAHLQRVAKELAEQLVRQIWPLISENDFLTERDAIKPLLAAALAACAREASEECCKAMCGCCANPDWGWLPARWEETWSMWAHTHKDAKGKVGARCEASNIRKLAALERAVGEKGKA